MNTVQTEVERISQKEAIKTIITPQRQENEFRTAVVSAVRQEEPSFTNNQAQPVTAEEAIPNSPELENVNAERLGSEEFPLTHQDVQFAKDVITKPFTGKNVLYRVVHALGGLNILKRRIIQKSTAPKDGGEINI